MHKRTTETLVIFCFALSGLSALMYQTAWMRLFSITFGTSELAIATVLAAYMGGLALGSFIAGRYADFIRRPVKVYALLEGGVAIAALLVPWLLSLAYFVYGQMLGSQVAPPASGGIAQTIYYLVATFLIVGLPTVMMGATLPILAHHLVKTDQQIGPKIGLIYGVNTAGAVAGVLLASFVLLPRIGLNGVVWSGVAINGLIFLLATLLAKQNSDGRSASGEPVVEDSSPVTQSDISGRVMGWIQQPKWILIVMLLSGAASFIYEVLWTRLLGHMLGSSIYAFATMLSTFLAGIALGGALGGWFSRFFRNSASLMILLQIGIAISSAATFYFLEFQLAGSGTASSQILMSMLVLFPSALFIGATYPVAVRIFADDVANIGASSASVYAWNTVGAILGAIFAGFLLLPEFGFSGAIRFAVILNIALALVVACLILPIVERPRARWQAVAVLLLFFPTLLFFNPPRPTNVISSTAFAVTIPKNMQEMFFAVGKSSTVMLSSSDYYFDLRTNGLPEAQVFYRGSISPNNSQRWLGLLPVLARPDAESMLIIGLGGGTAVEGVPPTLSTVDVVELEENVLIANQMLSDKRNFDPITQDRVNIVVNDARNALNLTDKQYDLIVSQPSHPWTAGASHLFTKEFVQILKGHLNEDGVLLMWMNSEFVTEPLLLSLMATIQSEFNNVRVYETQRNVLNFVASDGALNIEEQMRITGRPLSDAPHFYRVNGLLAITDVLAILRLDEVGVKEIVAGHTIVTDNKNLMATDSMPLANGLSEDSVSELFEAFDPYLDAGSELRSQMGTAGLELISRKMLETGQIKRVGLINQSLDSIVIPAMHAEIIKRDRSEAMRLVDMAIEKEPKNLNALHLKFNLLTLDPSNFNRIEEMSSSLDEMAEWVASAWLAREEGRISDIVSMEAHLQRVPSWHLLYGMALELRADWRLQLGVEQDEAMRLIEIAISEDGNYRRHYVRAILAANVGDSYAFQESVTGYSYAVYSIRSQYVSGALDLSHQQISQMTAYQRDLLEYFHTPVFEFANPQRADSVQNEAEYLLTVLENIRIHIDS